MTPDERLALVQVKLERAEKHIRDLDLAVHVFLQTRPYVVRSEHDQHTAQRMFYVDVMASVPIEIVCIAGDAIHNLRSALDHLVWQLVLANGKKPDSKTSFPIFEDAAEYAARSPRKTQGVGNQAVKLFDSIKPYKSARIGLWWLHKLDIVDKHRMLFAAGMRVSGHTPLPSVRQKFAEGFRASRPNDPVPDFTKMFSATDPSLGVMKSGDILLSGPDSEMEENMSFLFDVSLNEPKIVEPQPITATIRTIANIVNRIVLGFKPCL